MLLNQGDGNSFFFADNGDGTFSRAAGEPGEATLSSVSGGYQMTDKNGNVTDFSSIGVMTRRTDTLGNETVYTYTDADGDGRSDELTQLTDPVGRLTTLAYAGGRISSITDDTGRQTDFQFDSSGRMTNIIGPDPDGTGPLDRPERTFGYDATTNLMTSQTDPNGQSSSFVYNSLRMLQSITNVNGETEQMSATQGYGLVDRGSGVGTVTNPAPLFPADEAGGSRTDALGNESDFQLDRFGRPLSTTDADGNTTTYERNADGLVTKQTDPDLDGAGPLASPVTLMGYDANNNLISVTHPNGSTESWTYDATFNVPTSHTDPLGNITQFTIDPTTGLTTQTVTDVGGINATTQFTYTPSPVTGTDPPAGLISTITDPLGHVTRRIYNHHGLPTQIIFAEGTPVEASIHMEYDSRDNLTAEIDELGRRTEYTYDQLDRLIQVTQPDPDGTGPQASPVYTFTFDANSYLTSQTDPLGNVTSYQNDALGRPIVITTPDHDGDGQLTTASQTFDAVGNLLTSTNPLGHTTTMGYDVLNRLATITAPDPDGSGPLTAPVTTMGYDPLSRRASVTDPLGRITATAYNHLTNTITSTRPDPDGSGPLTSPVYHTTTDAAGNIITQTDALGRQTHFAYDGLNRLVSVTLPDPDGSGPQTSPVRSYTYDLASNLISETDPLGNVTLMAYDARNRLVSITHPDPDAGGPLSSPVESFTYDAASQRIAETDALGRVTDYGFDNLGRLVTVTGPKPDATSARPVTSFTFDAGNNLLSSTDPLGHSVSFTYDSHNNRITQTDALSGVTTWSYNDADQVISTTDPLGRTVTMQRDAMDRVIVQTDPDPDGSGPLAAATHSFTYDAASNLTGQSDPLGHTTTNVYDNLDRRISTTDALSGTTQYTFDAVGNMLSLTDPENNTTSWTYDNLDRVTLDTNELNNSRSYEYDANNNLVKRTDRNGRVSQFGYDHLDRMNEESWYVGGTLQETRDFRYDIVNRLTSINSDEAINSSAYDDLDRRTQTIRDYLTLTAIPSVTSNSVFDLAGRRTQISAKINSNDDFVTDFDYDALNRMTGIEQHGVTGGNTVGTKRVDFTYDAAGQFDTISRYEDLTATSLVAKSDYTFDNAGRLTDLTHSQPAGSGVLADYGWTFDAAGRLTHTTSLADGDVNYAYDNTNQLTGATYTTTTGQTPPPPDESYTFDANGNRDTAGTQSTTIGTDNRLLSDGTYNYQYDAEGNRTKKTSIATGASTDYTWDFHNNLIKVIEKTPSGVTIKTVQYGYDALDQKVWKKVTDSTGTRTEAYVYDGLRDERGSAGDQLILRFDGAGDLTNRYLHGPAVDQVLADEQITPTTNNTLWSLTDHQNTVRDLVDFNTSTHLTSIADHLTYTSTGAIASESAPAIDHLFGYTGREWDSDIDLQHNRARWYDPNTGTWLSNDPIGFAAGDANLYRYVGNQPTTMTDPSGLEPPRTIPLVGPDGQPYNGPPITPAPPIQHGTLLPLSESPSTTQLPADNIFGIRPHQVGDPAYSYNNTPPFAMAFIRGTCDYSQASDIRNATYAARRRISNALDLLRNYPDEVADWYKNTVMVSKVLNDPANHPRIIEMLEGVDRELERGNVPFYVRSRNNGNAGERVAYVNFYLSWRMGRYININPRFFSCPGGASQQTGVVLHEIGRFYAGLGETGTGTWKDVEVWDAIINSLNHNRQYIENRATR